MAKSWLRGSFILDWYALSENEWQWVSVCPGIQKLIGMVSKTGQKFENWRTEHQLPLCVGALSMWLGCFHSSSSSSFSNASFLCLKCLHELQLCPVVEDRNHTRYAGRGCGKSTYIQSRYQHTITAWYERFQRNPVILYFLRCFFSFLPLNYTLVWLVRVVLWLPRLTRKAEAFG
jgi:hypothetical protein